MPDARSRDTSAELPEHRLRALWALLAGQRGRALAAATAIVCATAASLAPPYLAGRVVDAAAHHRGNSTVALLAAAFLASSALVFATSRAQTLLVGIVGQAVLRDLRVRAFRHLLRQPLAYHHRVATGTSLSRITNDIQALDQLLSDGAVTFVSATLTLVGLALYLILSPTADPDRFWTLVLATDFACFGCLPWIQTRTPRAFEPGDPWRSRLRPLNLLIVHRASIQVNTFPSGHTAEALAIALLMLEAGPWAFAALVAVAAAISAGAVLGRYHYLADAVAGYFVALGVWIVVTPR